MEQTLQQRRAKFALDEVKGAVGKAGTKPKEFRSYASDLPAMIQMNGLGPAMAFCRAKGGTYQQLYDILSGWLAGGGGVYPGQDLLEGITGQDMHRYRLAQAEALAFLDWLKKFALAYMPKEQQNPREAS